MQKQQELYNFLVSKASETTRKWYEGLDKTTEGVYGSTDPKEIETLKSQNYEFHLNFFKVFIKEEKIFLRELEDWILMIATDEKYLETPSDLILAEFFVMRNQYFRLIDQFIDLHKESYSLEDKENFKRLIIRTMDKISVWFLEEADTYAMKRMQESKKIIRELSSPVITLSKEIGLLPLVGAIDADRAKFILEYTLKKCAKKRLTCLLIDLSGVVIIDTMVAQQIYQLSEALMMLGVKTVLCGIRPEIARTSVELGLSFENIRIFPTLESALNSRQIEFEV